MEKHARVQDVPDYEVRTPLQRVVQLLKRHRDVRYCGDEDKPVSIIATTLAAQAYDNEADIVDALLNVVPRMRDSIENRNGVWWIPNPVNPAENFADKWAEKPRKAELFFQWLQAAEREHKELLTEDGFAKAGEYLDASYGTREAAAAMTKYASRTGAPGKKYPSSVSSVLPILRESRQLSRFNVAHRQSPLWPVTPKYEVTISARAFRHGYRPFTFASDSATLRKGLSLEYEIATNVPKPFEVFWQVVNTGEAAEGANDLRGAIVRGHRSHKETTKYTGMHWVECFIIKDGWCVARSGEFVINVE